MWRPPGAAAQGVEGKLLRRLPQVGACAYLPLLVELMRTAVHRLTTWHDCSLPLLPLGRPCAGCRRIFPPMPGGVVEALRFTPAGALLAAYYGGVSVLGTMPDVPSMELPYQVGCGLGV